jgi:hypothetical protein
MARELAGSCLCGKARYRVADAFDYAMNCHCSRCRRATGSAFKPMGGVPLGKLRLETGPDSILTYGKADAADIHCAACGSLLYSVVREGQWRMSPMAR